MRVSRIRYQPIEGGTLGGQFALHVRLGAGDGPESSSFEIDASNLATKIHDAFKTLDLKSSAIRGVLIDARDDENVDSNEMISLLGTLHDWNLTIVAWAEARKRAAWFERVNYLTVFVRTQHWPNFRVNEIRYVDIELVEPDVFEVNTNAMCYLDAFMTNAKDVLTFVTSAKRLWGVIDSSASIDFPLGEPS
jgi:hypothetical protein